MNFIKQIERLQLLNKLIREEKTGSPSQLANRLGVSRSKLYEMIDHMECLGMEVHYDRSRNTFACRRETYLDINFSLSVIDQGEAKKIVGGQHFFTSVLFSGRSESTLESRLNRLI